MTTQIGQRIVSSIDHKLPVLLFFVSSFCSKCHHNRLKLQKYIDRSEILEINISTSTPLLEEIRPTSVPFMVVVDTTHRIIYRGDDLISDAVAKKICNLMGKLNNLDNNLV